MATYNGAKYIREQVDSILNQEFTENKDVEMELVVSDDGSTDDTLKILESYGDSRKMLIVYTASVWHLRERRWVITCLSLRLSQDTINICSIVRFGVKH